MKLRPPTLEDLSAASEVVAARQTADLGVVDFTAEDLRDAWRRSDLDLAADARLVEDESSSVIGCGWVGPDGGLAAITPAAEGRGAGGLLLDWLEQRQLQQGRSEHAQVVAATNRTAVRLLGARGYRLLRSYHRMATSLDELPGPQPLRGVELRRFAAQDAEAIHALDDRAFAGASDYQPHSLAGFREEHLEVHNHRPDLSLTAWSDEEMVGFLLTRVRRSGTVGFVDILAVDPAHQGRGIGRALLLRAFGDYAAAGLKEAQLGVSSDNSRARQLYESAGMTSAFRHDIYTRPV